MRFLRIATGYLAAAYCASFAAWLFVASKGDWPAIAFARIPALALPGMLLSIPLTILLFAFFITLAEKYRVRNLGYYALTGALTGITALLPFEYQDGSGPIGSFVIWGPAGAVCGTVYWLIAGRRAGEAPRAGMALAWSIGAGFAVGAIITAVAASVPNTLWINAWDGLPFLGPLFVLTSTVASYVICARTVRDAGT
jgi:hypothetical protein